MGLKKLAETIIFQSLEDIWDGRHRAQSVEFFSGEGFHICAQMAGIDVNERLKLLNLARKILRHTSPEKMTAAEKHIVRAAAKTPVMTL